MDHNDLATSTGGVHKEPQATTGKTLPAAHLKGQRQLGAGGERVGEARKPPETRISIFGTG